MQLSGDWDSYQETICSVDPSGRGTDETAAAYISQRNGFLYLHEMRAYRDGYSDQTLLDILKGCGKYGVTKLVIETNFGDGIVAELFKKHLIQTKQGIDVEEVRANVRKEDRIIDALEPILNQHRLVVDRSVKYFTDCMSISAQQVIAQRRLDEWNDLLQESIDHPQESANHLVFGMNKDQRQQARGISQNGVYTWV
jgi:hypothetical protein